MITAGGEYEGVHASVRFKATPPALRLTKNTVTCTLFTKIKSEQFIEQ
jgi:hypothetical protein